MTRMLPGHLLGEEGPGYSQEQLNRFHLFISLEMAECPMDRDGWGGQTETGLDIIA